MIYVQSLAGSTSAIVLALMLVSPLTAQVWEPRSVLLTNDRVITGRILQQGDQVRIKQNEGNEIRVDRKQVTAIGANVHELYQYKLQKLPRTARGGDHSQLARWCLSVNLLAEAGEHYLQLTQSHPANSDQRVKKLGVEITDKMLQQNDFRIAIGMQPLDRNSPIANSTANASPSTSTSPSATVAFASASTLTTSGAIPGRLQARFAEQTQHILINRCGQAGCHGHASKTPFRLLEVGGRDAANQTQQNLDSVLRYVSQDPKAKSLLIEYLMKTHGMMNAPAIGVREASLANEVVNWVQMVQNPVVTAEALAQPNALNPLTPGAPDLRQVPRPPTQASSGDEVTFPEGADIPTAAELDALDAQVRQSQETSSNPTNQGNLDQFDPGEFNRQASRRE